MCSVASLPSLLPRRRFRFLPSRCLFPLGALPPPLLSLSSCSKQLTPLPLVRLPQRYLSGHLILLLPSLDTPLHLFETLLALILFYNIAQSMLALNRLSTLPTASLSTLPSLPLPNPPPSPLRQSALNTPTHSSPKTRPSPSPSHTTPTTTPTFRRSALSSPDPPSPQTPSSLSRSARLC